jgi:hypothetical protein
MPVPQLKEKAILLGFDAEEKCVYSEVINRSDYYERNHIWEDDTTVKHLRLQRVMGYVFDSFGLMMQQFESSFDPNSGSFKNGWCRSADGSVQLYGDITVSKEL